MSESTHDDTTPSTPQAENWDDILTQPIARLADDATASEGGWRAVREVGAISPRAQQAPVQLTPIDSVMRLHLPTQPEEDSPADARLPDSLADQLSLTWASRRRQSPIEEPEPEEAGDGWPSSGPSAAPSVQAAQAPTPAPVATRQDAQSAPRAEAPLWRRPLDLVTRAFKRETPAQAPETEPRPAEMPVSVAAAPVDRPLARQETPAPALPATAVQRIAQPAPVKPRLDAANPYEEEEPQQPGAAQEQDKPVDLTLAMQPNSRAGEKPMTPVPPEDEEDKRTDSATPVARSDAASNPTVVASRGAPDLPAPSPAPRATSARLGETPAPDEDDAALPGAVKPQGRSFLSWLRPRDVARAPVDRALPGGETDAPAASQARRADAQPAANVAPVQRAAAGQQPETLPSTGVPLNHRATPAAPDIEPREDEAPSAPAASLPSAAATVAAAAPPEPGDPLPPGLQRRMEGLLDVPLREVRVFRGQTSQRLTSQLRADAVTVGNQIHVAPGRGDPSQPQGQALLGHELSHVASRQAGAAPAAREDETSADSAATTSLPPNVSPQEDEARAMRLEHAMLRADTPATPARPAAPRPAAQPPAPLSLEHRAPPPQIVVTPDLMASMGGGLSGSHADGWGGQGAAFQAALNDAATAPWDRLAEQAESMAGSAINSAVDQGAALATEGVQAAAGAAAGAIGDEDGLIDRVVDAVISRIEQEGAEARERGSSFVPHFGG